MAPKCCANSPDT